MVSVHIRQILPILVLFGASSVAWGQPTPKTKLDSEFAPYMKKATMPSGGTSNLTTYRDQGFSQPITPAEKAYLDGMAAYYVYRLTEPKYHANEESSGSADLTPRLRSFTIPYLLDDVRKYIHPVPNLSAADSSTWEPNRRAYVAEFGAALDKRIMEVMTDKNPPAILRVSAARMLANVTVSGAPAHWITVQKILKDPKLQPDVAYYALEAAGNLFGAYDYRKKWLYNGKQWVEEELLVDLAKTVEEYITKPLPFLDRVAGSKRKAGEAIDLKTLTPGEIAVTHFYRLQAIRALGKLRYDSVGGTQATEYRPILTLLKIALNDPSIIPAANSREISEAVMGICTAEPGLDMNLDDVIIAVAYGVKAFALPASGAVDADRSVLWKTYGERMKYNMTQWSKKIDKINRIGPNQKKKIEELVQISSTNVFEPLGKSNTGVVGNRLDLTKLSDWINKHKAPEKNSSSFFRESKTTIAFPQE